MRSINTKITLILTGGFLLQVILVASLFRVVFAKQILAEINNHEEVRQVILQKAVTGIEKIGNKPERIEVFIDELSKKTNVDFSLKDFDGNTVYSTSLPKNESRKIQEVDFIKIKGKPAYIIYAYFPPKINSVAKTVPGKKARQYLGLIVVAVSFITSFLIYGVLAVPIKNLRRAVKSMDYGNTNVKIPYYANDELGELCRSFEDMGRRLKKSEDSQIELIQAVSHDLKTPLTSILGYVKRLIDGKVNDDEKRQEYFEIIYRKANDLKNLLGELEEYALLSGGAKYNMKPVDCTKFFSEMCDELKHDVIQKGGNFEYINYLEGDHQIFIDEARIRRVFVNIVQNSLKYAGDSCTITAKCSNRGSGIFFELCDNGEGVPEDQLEKIFDRFYRIDTSRSREKGGTGLGLAICKGIIEAHGGEIAARISDEGGLCIYFTIPEKL